MPRENILIQPIPGAVAVLQQQGRIFEGDLCEYDGAIYAKIGNRYIGLRKTDGWTSARNIKWIKIHGMDPDFDKLGRMIEKR